MTAPATIHPTRTTPPPRIYALVDAEILAGQLVYALDQIREHAGLAGLPLLGLLDALDAAEDAQDLITILQYKERHS